MLDRAPLEVVPLYLRTLWRGLYSGGLKRGGGQRVQDRKGHFTVSWSRYLDK